MAEKLFNIEIMEAKELFELQTPKAEDAFNIFKEKMGLGTANLINLYNPDKIVFGGAVALNHFEDVKSAVDNISEDDLVNKRPEVVLCGLNENSVLHGLRASCNRKIKVKN